MPQRFLKPGIRESPRFNLVSFEAQSLYVRLLTLVDDYGLYDAHPLLLARVAFPYGDPRGRAIKPEKLSEYLQDLAQQDLVELYQMNGSQYIRIKRWTERNRLKNPSRFPMPDGICQQMLSDDSTRGQMLSNAAPPSASSSASSSASHEGKKNVAGALAASRTQFAALNALISELEARGDDLTVEERKLLREKKREKNELQSRQARGEF